MICFSSAGALSYSSRAGGAIVGCSRMAGKRPFSSHAEKKNVQSMYLRDLGERHIVQVSPPDEPWRGDDVVVPVESSGGWRAPAA